MRGVLRALEVLADDEELPTATRCLLRMVVTYPVDEDDLGLVVAAAVGVRRGCASPREVEVAALRAMRRAVARRDPPPA